MGLPAAVEPARSATLPRVRESWGAAPLLTPAAALFLTVFLAPLAILLAYSVVPDARDFSLAQPTIRHYAKALLDSFYAGILLDTVLLAATITLLTLAVGYPLAYVIARSRASLRGLLLALVIAPLLTNIIVRTLGWLVILGDHGLVNEWLLQWGILREPIELLGTKRAIVVALVHIFLPFMVLPLVGAIENVDRNLEEAAGTLGAGSLRAFAEVVIPLSMPGILVGSTLVFLLSMGAFITPLVLGLGRVWMISIVIYNQVRVVNWAFAGALSFCLLAATITVVVGMNAAGGRVARFGGVTGARRPRRWRRRGWADRVWRIVDALTPRSVPGAARVLPAYCVVVYAFLLAPLLVVVRSALDTRTLVSGAFQGYTLKWFAAALTNPEYLAALRLSLRLALTTTALSLVVGTAAALGLVRYRFPGRTTLATLFLSPLTIPTIITGIALLLYFQSLGVGASFTRLLAAHLLLATPYVIRSVTAALQGVDPALEESASTLGASPAQVFRRVTVPLIRPGLFSAAIFAFLVSFDEVTMTLLIAGTRLLTLPVRILAQLEQVWDPSVSALSTMMIAVTLLGVIGLNRLVGLSKLKV